jgi:hypothetical protein
MGDNFLRPDIHQLEKAFLRPAIDVRKGVSQRLGISASTIVPVIGGQGNRRPSGRI